MIDYNKVYIGMSVKLNRTIRVNAYPDNPHVYIEGKLGKILDVYDIGAGRDTYSVIDVEFEDGSCLFQQPLFDYDSYVER